MRIKEDLTERTFDKLTVLREAPTRAKGRRYWVCRCACGREKEFNQSNLLRKLSKSCGCGRATHGGSKTPTYRIWTGMMSRCHHPKDKAYGRYGGCGIFVCERWHHFENFLVDMGERPNPTATLERKRGAEGYHPDNVIWASRFIQANNTSRNRRLTWNDRTETVAEWARITGIRDSLIVTRLDRLGWSEEEALGIPPRYGNKVKWFRSSKSPSD